MVQRSQKVVPGVGRPPGGAGGSAPWIITILLGIGTGLGWAAGGADPRIVPSRGQEARLVGQTYDPAEAAALARRLGRAGRKARVRQVPQELVGYQLLMGVYPTERQAEELRAVLAGRGIDSHGSAQIRRQGFVVVLGTYGRRQELQDRWRELEALGYGGLLAAVVRRTLTRYDVEEIVGPEAPGPGGALLAPAREAPAGPTPGSGDGPTTGWLRAGLFGRRSEAESIAADLRRMGLRTWVLEVVGSGYALGVDHPGGRVRAGALRRYLTSRGYPAMEIAAVLPQAVPPAAPPAPETSPPGSAAPRRLTGFP